MEINGALIWGLALVISLSLGVALATYRRDKRFSVAVLITRPQPTPPTYVIQQLRLEGARALLRGDVFFLTLFYCLMAILFGFGLGVVLVKNLA